MDDDDDHAVKKCRYCYFQVGFAWKVLDTLINPFFPQYLKLKNKRIESISSYCPIDLFSGKADRMNRAIEGLIMNPQNNMKMFLDGKIIFNEYSKDKRSLKQVMASLFPQASTSEK